MFKKRLKIRRKNLFSQVNIIHFSLCLIMGIDIFFSRYLIVIRYAFTEYIRPSLHG